MAVVQKGPLFSKDGTISSPSMSYTIKGDGAFIFDNGNIYSDGNGTLYAIKIFAQKDGFVDLEAGSLSASGSVIFDGNLTGNTASFTSLYSTSASAGSSYITGLSSLGDISSRGSLNLDSGKILSDGKGNLEIQSLTVLDSDGNESVYIDKTGGIFSSLEVPTLTVSASSNFAASTAFVRANIDNELNRASAAELLLQENLDTATKALSAAIDGNGGSLANLEAALQSEVSRAIASENTLQTTININTQSLSGDIISETERAKASEASIQSNLDSSVSDLNASIVSESVRAKGAESNLGGLIDAETSRAESVEASIQSSLNTNTQALSGSIALEVSRATLAESNLQTSIDTKSQALSANISSLSDSLQTASNSLQSQIAVEVNRAKTSESGLQESLDDTNQNLTNEVVRAKGAEGNLSNSITTVNNALTTEVERAVGAEQGLYLDISNLSLTVSTETARATAAENTLNNLINTNTTALSGYTAYLTPDGSAYSGNISKATLYTYDSNGVITSNTITAQQAYKQVLSNASSITSLNQNLSAEINRATGVESRLEAEIQSIAYAASAGEFMGDITAAVVYLRDSNNNIITSSTGAGLLTSIRTNSNSITGIESNVSELQSGLTNEINRAENVENSLSGLISTETSRATGAEATLSNNLSSEITRAKGVEAGLNTRLTTAESDISSLDTALANVLTIADSAIPSEEKDVANGVAAIDADGYILLPVNGGSSDTNHRLGYNQAADTFTIQASGNDLFTVSDSGAASAAIMYVNTLSLTDNTNKVATTAYVQGNIAKYLPLTGGTLTGPLTVDANLNTTGTLLLNYGGKSEDVSLNFYSAGGNSQSAYIMGSGGTAGVANSGDLEITSQNLTINVPGTINLSGGSGGKVLAYTVDTTDNSTNVATTAYVQNNLASKAVVTSDSNHKMELIWDGTDAVLYVDSNDVGDIAFKYWVEGAYLPLTGGELTGNLIVDDDLTVSGNASINQGATIQSAGKDSNGLNTASLQLTVPSGNLGVNSQLRMWSTFASSQDTGRRLTATIQTSFVSGAWGSERLSFFVNNGSANDDQLLSNQTEALYVTKDGCCTLTQPTSANSDFVATTAYVQNQNYTKQYSDINTYGGTLLGYNHVGDYIALYANNEWYLGATQTWVEKNYLALTGGTLSGGISLEYLTLNAPNADWKTIYFQSDGNTRFTICIDNETETGSNAGSNFALNRQDDSGDQYRVISISRATGVVTVNSGLIAPTPATSDSSTNVATTAYVQNNLANYLPLTGGTLTGDFNLDYNGAEINLGSSSVSGNTAHLYFYSSGNGYSSSDAYIACSEGSSTTNDGLLTIAAGSISLVGSVTSTTMATTDNSTNVATTAYVQNNLANYLPLTGGTLTGALTVGGDLTIPNNNNLWAGKWIQFNYNGTAAENDIFFHSAGGSAASAQITATGGTSGAALSGNIGLEANVTTVSNILQVSGTIESSNYLTLSAAAAGDTCLFVTGDYVCNMAGGTTWVATVATSDSSNNAASTAFVKNQNYISTFTDSQTDSISQIAYQKNSDYLSIYDEVAGEWVYGATQSWVKNNFTASSDPALKKNMIVLDSHKSLSGLDSIQLYDYDWIDESKGHVPVGFNSKNLLEVWPDTVKVYEQKEGEYEPDTINVLNLIARLTDCIKEQKAQIENLKTKIEQGNLNG